MRVGNVAFTAWSLRKYLKLKATPSVMSEDGRSSKVCVKDQLGYKHN